MIEIPIPDAVSRPDWTAIGTWTVEGLDAIVWVAGDPDEASFGLVLPPEVMPWDAEPDPELEWPLADLLMADAYTPESMLPSLGPDDFGLGVPGGETDGEAP